MTKSMCEEIYENIPESAIVHIKTKNGDKICIKDNSKSVDNKITTIFRDAYMEITSKNVLDKKTSLSSIFISYDNILQLETVCNFKSEN